jgi:hypothetical protein
VQNIRPDAVEYRAVRNWHLQIWNLTGPPETWERQLYGREAAEPVFAIVSGIGRTTWAPIHRFCQRKHVPCLLPNVDLPPVQDEDFYSIYYSRGVFLDADLILTRLSGAVRWAAGSRLVQIFRSDDIGATAAAALSQAASKIGVSVVDHALAPLDAASGIGAAGGIARAHTQLMEALAGLRDADTLVLWLRPPDIAAIGDAPPPATIYVSGLLANLEFAPFPAGWRGPVRLTYPYDPPDLRRVRENFPHAWFRQRGIAVTSDRVQSNTYLACTIVADALDGMLDGFVPELLIERVEGMLSRRQSTGFFPRLSLATGQRFASKGGFVVKFEGVQGIRVKADGEWTVP